MTRATIFEEHSSVLAHWYSAGVRDATLIYLDAHLDLQFIDPARIARLAACAGGAAMAQLESPHCLSPDRSYCYGIEDFLYPAAQLGMLRRVVWVAPPHVLKAGMSAALRGLLQMEGVTIADLESFHALDGGALHGRLLGVELTICELQHLPALPLHGPLVVDIDADYFVAVPADLVWAEPRAVVAALKQVAGQDGGVTIARSVGSGFLPLRHRFLADHLAALWEGRSDDAGHWQRLLDLDRATAGCSRADHHAAYAGQLLRRPDCAASAYGYALATPDPAQRAALLAMAAKLDDAYADDLVRVAGEWRARRLRVDLTQVMALQREVETAGLDASRQAIAWVSLGCLFAAFGQLEQAADCDARSHLDGSGHPELALEIAKLHMARGRFDAALPFLERAAADDETRVGAWLHLAECAHAQGDHAGAGEWGLLAHTAAPAWPQPLQRLAVFANARGAAREAGQLLARHAELDRRIRMLAARLG